MMRASRVVGMSVGLEVDAGHAQPLRYDVPVGLQPPDHLDQDVQEQLALRRLQLLHGVEQEVRPLRGNPRRHLALPRQLQG
jgi:hypothetical protein